MKKLLAALLLIPTAAFGQAAIRQSGTVSPNDMPKWTQAQILQSAGGLLGDQTGVGINPFAITDNLNLGLCFRSDTVGTHTFCLGHSNAAAPLFTVDNVNYSFPPVGGGNTSGPVSTTVGALALWNVTNGSLLKDGTIAFPSSFSSTPTNFATFSVGTAIPLADQIPAGVIQGLTGTLTVPVTYTQAPWPNTIYSAYANNLNTQTGSSEVNYFAVAATNGGGVFSFNSILANTDIATAIGGAASGSGHNFQIAVGAEYDINIMKVGASAAGGEVDAIKFIGGGEANPVGGAYMMHGFSAGTGVPWDWGFRTEPGAATIGVDLGPLASGNNHASQPIYLRSTSSGGGSNVAMISNDANGNLTLGAVTVIGATFNTSANTGYNIEGANTLQRDDTGHTTSLFDYAGNVALVLGGSPGSAQNLYRNTTHIFQTISGAATLATLTTSSLNLGSGVIYAANGVNGVSCPANTINLTTAVATNGILTHC